jgi:YD repeat-containing protein
VGSTISATVELGAAPPVSTSAHVWDWYLQPDTGINTAYSIAGASVSLNGSDELPIYIGGLPAGEYKICAYIDPGVYGSYPYGFGGSICSPGHADPGGTDFQGPYFTVTTATNVAVDVGAMQWPTIEDELDAGWNPSEGFCECDRGDPIDTMTGAFTESATDLPLPGVGPDIDIEREYASSDASTQSQFGNGWHSQLSMQLTNPDGSLDEDTQPPVVNFVQENGSVDTFYQDDITGNYAASTRIHATLSWDPDTLEWTVVRNDRDTFVFDATGALQSDTDIDGNTVTYGRDGSGNITSMTGSGGRSITFTYTGPLITSATDSAGRTVTYGYDGNGNLTSVTDPTGAITTYGYSSSNLLTTVTKPDGGVTTNTYDSSNRVTKQVDAMNRATTFNYTGSGKTIVTSPDGSELADYYVSNVLMSVSKNAGSASPDTTSYTYDSDLNVATTTDPMGNVTTATHDGNGNVLTTTDVLGKTTTNTYDANNNELTTTDPLGHDTVYTYSATDHPLTKTMPSGSEEAWTYNADGTVATSTSGRSKVTSYGYDSAGRQTTQTDPDSRTTTVGYNAAGYVNSKRTQPET